MLKKREEEREKNQTELADLESLRVLKDQDMTHFKEELNNRKLNPDEYQGRIIVL
jgi:hypothetical protein